MATTCSPAAVLAAGPAADDPAQHARLARLGVMPEGLDQAASAGLVKAINGFDVGLGHDVDRAAALGALVTA
ncbi:hypothetical protein GCM10009555_032340 [Acrocarpospora macrocephala]|uniref:Uncharacterized protein n=1 Tax=Acrocarpospora macrocephala TaxID=150177 RepID=A0A5M3WBJ9_9ACTN|nr:hypothetical protein [Acrocarpospora macrocephala]GES06415.1 hypothetical protein Amac_000100 [Acrocarpospora macrocephala]